MITLKTLEFTRNKNVKMHLTILKINGNIYNKSVYLKIYV